MCGCVGGRLELQVGDPSENNECLLTFVSLRTHFFDHWTLGACVRCAHSHSAEVGGYYKPSCELPLFVPCIRRPLVGLDGSIEAFAGAPDRGGETDAAQTGALLCALFQCASTLGELDRFSIAEYVDRECVVDWGGGGSGRMHFWSWP